MDTGLAGYFPGALFVGLLFALLIPWRPMFLFLKRRLRW